MMSTVSTFYEPTVKERLQPLRSLVMALIVLYLIRRGGLAFWGLYRAGYFNDRPGTAVGSGLAMLLLCAAALQFLWIPFRTMLFPRSMSGPLSRFEVSNNPRTGRRLLRICIGEETIGAMYTPRLVQALTQLPPQTNVKVSIGANGTVVRIERA